MQVEIQIHIMYLYLCISVCICICILYLCIFCVFVFVFVFCILTPFCEILSRDFGSKLCFLTVPSRFFRPVGILSPSLTPKPNI